MSAYVRPEVTELEISPSNKIFAGRCLTASSGCGHGEDGCMTPNLEIPKVEAVAVADMVSNQKE